MCPRLPAVLLLAASCLGAAPAWAAPPARTDRYGDLLPPGAVARLGTERLTLSRAIFPTFSPDGRYLAAACGGSEGLRVWEVATGKEVLRLRPPRFGGYSPSMAPLAFSPDGKAIALGCSEKTVRVWEVTTGKELNHFGGLPGPAGRLAFGPGGRLLFAGCGGQVHCWELTRPGPPRTFGTFEGVAFLAVSRDGKTLLAGGGHEPPDWQKRTFARWDVASGKELGRQSRPASRRWACALSPDGGAFAVPEDDGKSIAVLDPLTGRERARAEGSDYPAHIAFSADGATMACSSRDGVIRVWETDTGKPRARFRASTPEIDWVALSPDGKVVAAVSHWDDAAVHLWDVATARELHPFPGPRGGPLTVAFVGDGREVATVSQIAGFTRPTPRWGDWSLCRWDAATGALRAAIRCRPPGEVHFTAFAPDGRRVVTVLHDGTWQLWDVEAGKELRAWKVPFAPPSYTSRGKNMLAPPAFTPDCQVLLAATGPTVERWEAGTGKELPPFPVEGMREPRVCCAASPDGRALAVTSGGRVALLGAADGKVRHRLEGLRGGGLGFPPAFSPDGRTLAVAEGGAVSLWEVASGRPRGRLAGGPAAAFALAFSPDGRLLAGGGPEGAVTLWDLATGEIAGRLRADLGRVGSLAFSPYGTRLAVAGFSPAALVCDVAGLCGKKELGQLAQLPAPSAEELEGLWADLGGARGARAEPALRQALEGNPSAELRRRAQRLLGRLGATAERPPSAELVRLRAVEALEANGTPEARKALAGLATGLAVSPLAAEAKAALARLAKRPGGRQ
jgi:WD40 repeat protein